jgi:hypothetical protein
VVKTFRRSEPFEAFVQGATQGFVFRHTPLIELADAHNAELIARPFTRNTVGHGVVPEFLQAIGLDPSQIRETNVRRNEAAGPFTVSVARGVMRSINGTGKQLKWLQAVRCKTKLAAYLEENRLADAGYCGLTTALAQQIEAEMRPDNDAFAQRVWCRPWAEIFAAQRLRDVPAGRIHPASTRAGHSRDDGNCRTGPARAGPCRRSALERLAWTGWLDSKRVDSKNLAAEVSRSLM